jgi:hypothetical protein
MDRFVSVPAATRGSQAWDRLAGALAWQPADTA